MSGERRRIEVVGAAILDGSGRCLVTQRSASMSAPLKWEFPGGKVEAGESPQGALAREIAEELGLTIRVGAWLGRGEAGDAERVIVLDVYLARIEGGELVLREHSAWRWCGAEALGELDWAAPDVPILEALRAQLA